MTQNSLNVVIDNDTSSAVRSDLNDVLLDITTLHAGTAEPTTTYANMFWYDTENNILKMRNEADSGWASIGYLDQGVGAFRILDDTQVVNTSGTQTGLLGDQATATWEAGTGTTESLVSPAKVKAAIDANTNPGIGWDQTWQNVISSRAAYTSFQNTTGKPIMVAMSGATSTPPIQVSSNNVNWVTVGYVGDVGNFRDSTQFIVPDGHYYRVNGGVDLWAELR